MGIKCPSERRFPPRLRQRSSDGGGRNQKAAIPGTIRKVLACEGPTETRNGQIVSHDGKYPSLTTVNFRASSILGARLKLLADRPDPELNSSIMACRVPGGTVAPGVHDRAFRVTRPLMMQLRRVAGA
jgi:hypothetical protein